MLAIGMGVACAGALGGGPGCGEMELASLPDDEEPPWHARGDAAMATSAAKGASRVARISINP
jgi:hypothetical protein